MFWNYNDQLNRIEKMLTDIHNHVVDIHNHITVLHNQMDNFQEETQKMALDLAALTEEVTRLETVEAGAVTLLHSLADEVAALKNDPVALQALVDRIKASDDVLAQAIVDNTPVAPVV